MTTGRATLLDTLAGAGDGLLLVVTGAGISLASGIPTFRGSDPGAVWKKDITELGTHRYFTQDPVGSWRWYTERFDLVLDKEANAAHLALVDLERWQINRGGDFVLITQNVDPLHEGSSRGSVTFAVESATGRLNRRQRREASLHGLVMMPPGTWTTRRLEDGSGVVAA